MSDVKERESRFGFGVCGLWHWEERRVVVVRLLKVGWVYGLVSFVEDCSVVVIQGFSFHGGNGG